MATLKLTWHYTFADANGNLSTTHVNSSTSDTSVLSDLKSAANNLATPLAALSNAKLVDQSMSIQFDRAQGVGTDAEFPLNAQKALLTFTNAFGSKQSIGVPAPKEAIFLAPPGDAQVNMANALVIAFHTAWSTLIADAGGNALNLLTSGVLQDRRITRRAPRRTATA